MAEAAAASIESGSPIPDMAFRLTHVGNARAVESLNKFQELGMTGPSAAASLLSLFEAIPFTEETHGLVRTGDIKPETTLWDQVGWAYSHPKEIPQEAKDSLLTLQYFALDSLANQPQIQCGDEIQNIPPVVKDAAQQAFHAYETKLSEVFDPDNPDTVKAFNTIKNVSQVAGKVAKVGAVFVLASKLMACTPIRTETPIVSPPGMTETVPAITKTEAPYVTQEPTKKPTSEIAQPSVPNGLRVENAATQVVENGTWVVKNADGKVTATWNKETKTWTYSAENIDVAYTQIGLNVDKALIEPFLGPLPPDDLSTHFVDSTGNPVGYGIGPETIMITEGSAGRITYEETEVFARFRGVVQIPDSIFSATVFEIPRSADSSIILVIRGTYDGFYFLGSPGNNYMYDQFSVISPEGTGAQYAAIANNELFGHMIMFRVTHDAAKLYANTQDFDRYVSMDEYARVFLDYIGGRSTQVPRSELLDTMQQSIDPGLIVPESEFPSQ